MSGNEFISLKWHKRVALKSNWQLIVNWCNAVCMVPLLED